MELSLRSDFNHLLGNFYRLILCLNSLDDSAGVEDWKFNFGDRLIVILLLLLALSLETLVVLVVYQAMLKLLLSWGFGDFGLLFVLHNPFRKIQ